MKALFIGNSHTFANDMPLTFARIARSAGEEVDVVMLASPGVTLGWHAQQSQTRANILGGDWDCIVLQQAAHPFAGFENLLREARQLVELITTTRAKPVLFMPWASAKDPSAQKELEESYLRASEILQSDLAPIGTIWWQLLKEHPETSLFDPDREHANFAGSYLAACVFYSLVFQRSPEGLDTPPPVSDREARLIQQQVAKSRIYRVPDTLPARIPGTKVHLRDMTLSDLPRYSHWRQPGHEWQRFDGPYYPPTPEQVAASIKRKRKTIETRAFPDPRTHLVIADAKTDELLGEVSWYWKSVETLWLCIGIDIYDPATWGKGLGLEALSLWIQYLFDKHPGIARIGLETWSGNEGMIKLATRLGCREEARIRKARIVKGQYFDSLSYGILREEWEALAPPSRAVVRK